MPVMRRGLRVTLPYLGDVEGTIADIHGRSFEVATINVDLGAAGSWSGLAAMVNVIVPPDTRHPAVNAAVAAASDAAILRLIEGPESLAAFGAAAALGWAADNPPDAPLVDRFAGAGWLRLLADAIEASVSNG